MLFLLIYYFMFDHSLMTCRKTFLIPEMLFEPSLLLNPHVFLLGILFGHRAFISDELNDRPAQLGYLDIQEGEFELPLGIRPELKDIFIFRKAKKLLTGYTLCNAPISGPTMSKWVTRIGEILGREENTICYNLRYFAGNSLDSM